MFDYEMGMLHLNGIAKSFKVEGQVTIEIKWTKGNRPTQAQLDEALKTDKKIYVK